MQDGIFNCLAYTTRCLVITLAKKMCKFWKKQYHFRQRKTKKTLRVVRKGPKYAYIFTQHKVSVLELTSLVPPLEIEIYKNKGMTAE